MTTQPLNDRAAQGARCPNCGNAVEPGGRGLGRIFCQPKCQQAYNARNKARGAILAPLATAAAQTRHAKPGTRQAAVSTYARAELTSIAAHFNEQDREAGRPPAWEYIEAMMKSGTRYMDRAGRYGTMRFS